MKRATPPPSIPDNEQLLPILDAIEKATGQRPHPATAHRWRTRGVAGIRLSSCCLGAKRLSSVPAVRRFRDQVTAAKDGHSPPSPRTNRQRESAVQRAEKELAGEGFGSNEQTSSAADRSTLPRAPPS